MNRRLFMQGGAAAGLLLVKPATAFTYQANSAVHLGLLGCGSRGTTVATSFQANTATRVVALADLFADQLAAAQAHFAGLPGSAESPLLFHGAHAFEQLAACPSVDLVQISTPPFFHVEHLQAAVAAGKHVYCEKPVGIDVAQARAALALEQTMRPGQSVAVGFQCRSAPPIAALAERVQAGALGKIATAAANYNAPASTEKGRAGASPAEYRLRNWLWDRALSGDILLEQNIHIIDLCNWLLGAHPLRAGATGGRSILRHAGDCWDNYQVNYLYPGGVRVSFTSTQFGNNGFDAGLRIHGAEGTASLSYAGPVRIEGAHPWAWEESPAAAKPAPGNFAANGSFLDNLLYADREKERRFIASIVSGPPQREISTGVEAALSCMLGRMAGYTQREVSWEELLAHGESYSLGMDLRQFA